MTSRLSTTPPESTSPPESAGLAAPPRAVAALVPLAAIVVLGFLAVGLPLAALPIHVHETLAFGTVAVGWTIGLQSLATVLTRGLAGSVVDGRGPRVAVLLGLPAAILGGLAYGASAAVAAPVAALAVLLVGRAALGLAESLFLTGTMTWGIARLGPARTGTVMSWQGLGMYAALSAGAPLGLLVERAGGFAAVAAAATLAPLLALGVAFALPGVAPPSRGGTPLPFRRVLVLVWREGTVLALGAVGFGTLVVFAPLLFSARGWDGAGLAITAFGVAYILVRLVGSGWPDRFGGRRVGAASLAVEVAGLLVLWRAADQATAILGAAITGLGFSLVFPSMGVEALRRVPAAARGMAVGAFVAFFDAALGLAGPVLGLLADRTGLNAPFAAAAGLSAAGLALVLAGGRRG